MHTCTCTQERAFSSMLSRGIKEFNSRAAAIKAQGEAGFDGQAHAHTHLHMHMHMHTSRRMVRRWP